MTTETQFGHYCPACAAKLRLKDGMNTENVLVTPYQRKKHDKHTGPPSSSHAVQSVFDQDSSGYYQKAIEETVNLGGVYQGYRCKSAIFCPSTSSQIGMKYYSGITGGETDTVVVVKTTDEGKTHALTEQSSVYLRTRCLVCGGPFLPGIGGAT